MKFQVVIFGSRTHSRGIYTGFTQKLVTSQKIALLSKISFISILGNLNEKSKQRKLFCGPR